MAYRLRLRSLLILIAASAVGMGAIVVGTRKVRQLREEYRVRASRHARFAAYYWESSRSFVLLARENRQWPDADFRTQHRIDETSKEYAARKALYMADADLCDKDRVTYSVRAAYHDRMKDKYLRAVARPWWPVPADPPPSELPNRESLLPTFIFVAPLWR